MAYGTFRQNRSRPRQKENPKNGGQGVNRFIDEFSLEAEKTLSNLNRKFSAWLDEGYIHDPHDALKAAERDPETGRIISETEVTPYQAYVRDPTKTKFVSSLECRDAFLWEESRTAGKTGCLSLSGIQYDVGPALIRKSVDIRHGPFDISLIEVWHEGKFVRKAEQLHMPEHLPRQPPGIPAEAKKPTHSRLLKVYEEQNKDREKQRNGALSFHGAKSPDKEKI